MDIEKIAAQVESEWKTIVEGEEFEFALEVARRVEKQDRELLIEACDELAWMHRMYMDKSPLSEGVPRIIRLLQKIEKHTGHETEGPYPMHNAK